MILLAGVAMVFLALFVVFAAVGGIAPESQ